MSAAMELHVALSLRLDAIEAYRLAHAYRDEVRAAAAADVHRAELPTFPAGETPENVAKVVRAVDVRLAQHGAQAPYGVEKGTAPATATPNFFQPDHTYQRRRWLFQCLAVAPNPFNGETRAVGFLYRPGEPATATGLDPDDWEHGGWTDVTEGGES
jgi:hypothetical protein